MNLPPLAYQCNFSERSSEIVRGSTTEFMKALDSQTTVEGEASISVPVKVVNISAGANFKTVNSSARESSFNASSEGSTQQITTSAIATLYSYALSKGQMKHFFSQDFQADLSILKDLPSAMRFIRLYGTHFIKRADMGARYQENIYISSETTEREKKQIKRKADEDGVGLKVGVESSDGGAKGELAGDQTTNTNQESTDIFKNDITTKY